MTVYELMIKTNKFLLDGGVLTDSQKEKIVRQFLEAADLPANRFCHGEKSSKRTSGQGRRMYPVFFIPPQNDGKKFKTILGQTPKTQILSANSYELETLRLLHLFASENSAVKEMVGETLERLKTTCFGYNDDGVGECFDASMIVLRFLIAVAPHEREWIQSRIDNYFSHVAKKKRPKASLDYFELCLNELSQLQ